MAAGIRYEMLHRLLVAPSYRILPPSPIPLVLITYLPGLGHPTHLRLRLISSARVHNLFTSHLVTHPFLSRGYLVNVWIKWLALNGYGQLPVAPCQ